MREPEGRVADEIINLNVRTLNILRSKSKIDSNGSSPQILLVSLELQLFLITDFATFKPEVYFFEAGKE